MLLGTIAGYYGGMVDRIVSRITELFMSFPLLLLVIALGQTVAQRFEGVTVNGFFQPGVLATRIVIGLFTGSIRPASCARSSSRSVSRSSSRQRT